MQFITDGPDIPDVLLQAHEEGRVVFFCGAGISYPAGLPDFKGLVLKIYELLGAKVSDSEIENDAFKREQYDATLNLLEHRLLGQRLELRRALAQALSPKVRRKGVVDTHSALLRLARSRKGALRLVTTNFDSLFEIAAKLTNQTFNADVAPMLPIPKDSRWNSLVYLHGRLPKIVDDAALNRLVITSGDFGLAYLTERWAARFVSELFRNYVVCFVGYSINDPVLRYMMDALAADRMLGETTPQAWALASFEPGQKHDEATRWEAKGVTPILYEASADHFALHKTLHTWAEIYRDGVEGKEAIVAKYARALPQDSTQQDDFVSRMLWALSDKTGLPAKLFAEFNPAPSLEWLLEAFIDARFRHSDLERFLVPPHKKVDDKLVFSFVRRPAPYNLAAPMMLASGSVVASQWDDVMFHVARWLLRHLGDPRLLLWITEYGGLLHDRWQWLIEHELDRIASLERDGKTGKLDEIRLQSPNAIPSLKMRTLWRLLLSGRVKTSSRDLHFYECVERMKREPMTTTLRLELRESLAPRVLLKKPYDWYDEVESTVEPASFRQLVDWELVLASDHVYSTLPSLSDERWSSALPFFLEEFQLLLRDALDLMRELGEADDRNDRSHWHLPSIMAHWQNRGFRDWVSLIALLRDAWLVVRIKDSARARRIAQDWFELPYPTFKRLALFAASQDDCISPEQWVDWLLADGAIWLWTTNTGREMFRLLVLQGRHLTGTAQECLEVAILAGPPREMFRDDLEPDHWQHLVARDIWLRLAKLESGGLDLGAAAAECLAELSTAHPEWKLAANESDEFSHWMSGTGDPDFEESRTIDVAPSKWQELVQWLTKPSSKDLIFNEDTWREVCQRHPIHSLCALAIIAAEGNWPAKRWSDALNVWGDKKKIQRMWRYAAPLVQRMPDDLLQENAHAVTYWLEAASKTVIRHEDLFLDLCRRTLDLPLDAGSGMTRNGKPIGEPVMEAINHPVGHVTQALINLWFKRKPNDSDLLPVAIEPFFTRLCDLQVERFRHGRVILASRLVAFYRVDRQWTERYLLPLLNWDNSIEARAAWDGFLWSPRLYEPLLIAFKMQFLETAKHYEDLGEHQNQFVAFLTYAALERPEGYTGEDFRSAFAALPQEGLEHSARALAQALEGAAEQREEYWRNRVRLFWQECWPKSGILASPEIADSLARLTVSARGEFPAAFHAVKYWLQPIPHLHRLAKLLHESGLCERFPTEALSILEAVIDNQAWAPAELTGCLDKIRLSKPQLEQDTKYKRLREYVRRFGH